VVEMQWYGAIGAINDTKVESQIQSMIHDKHDVITQRILEINKWARHYILF
jgi:hypothetical protein